MKKFNLIIAILSFTLIFASCNNTPTVIQRTVTDRMGQKVELPKEINRIASTATSNTETLLALGLADKLVLADTYSEGIEGLSEDTVLMDFYTPDIEKIIAAQPDIVFASGINKIGGQDPFAQLSDNGIAVVYIPVTETISGVYDDISFIANVTETNLKGEELIKKMKKDIAEVQKITDSIQVKKKVYFEISPAPAIYSFGSDTFTNEILTIAGGENIFENEKSWITPSEEAVISANPEVIITSANYTKDPIGEIESRVGWENITAVKEHKIYVVDPNTTSRTTHNLVIGIQEIAANLYPNLYE